MKKRIMSVILVCVLVMSALVGCGNNESETKTSSATTTDIVPFAISTMLMIV